MPDGGAAPLDVQAAPEERRQRQGQELSDEEVDLPAEGLSSVPVPRGISRYGPGGEVEGQTGILVLTVLNTFYGLSCDFPLSNPLFLHFTSPAFLILPLLSRGKWGGGRRSLDLVAYPPSHRRKSSSPAARKRKV